MSTETFEFQTEVQQLLDLMIRSVYSNKDVFLRELISNASDAIDRRRFAGLTDTRLLPEEDFEIFLETHAEGDERRLVIRDNGIGMSRDELVTNLGTIAKSGTKEFMKKIREAAASGAPDLIGQFGVGFYSALMVGERVLVDTLRAGETQGWRWASSGEGKYTITESDRKSAGTQVTLCLKPEDPEDGLRDYTQEWILREVVKRYSDFVAYPIRMRVERTEHGDDEKALPKTVVSTETLNSMKAIWMRPESEVSEEEYKEFYKHISHDWTDPLERIRATMEGTMEARALLFIPSRAPFDLHHRDIARRGVQLFAKRVFIMDECKDLLPDHLRFVKGVVDSEDLSLNISREMLQQDRQIRAIRAFLVRKVMDALQKMLDENRQKYLKLWAQLGPCLKEGLLGFEDKKDKLLGVLLASSTHHATELTTLDEYIERAMASRKQAGDGAAEAKDEAPTDTAEDGDDASKPPIYYVVGTHREATESSPHLEVFRDKGREVLIFTDHVDEAWLQTTHEYKGHRLQPVGKGEVDLESDTEKKAAEEKRKEREKELKDLLNRLRIHLQDDIKEVRISSRLTRSPACLVGDIGDLSPQMESMLRQMGQEVPKTKRILEVNPSHPIITKLKDLLDKDPKAQALEDYAEMLYGQALLAEGGTLPKPAEFTQKLSEVLLRAL
jgi:molecular chaperone HtpG